MRHDCTTALQPGRQQDLISNKILNRGGGKDNTDFGAKHTTREKASFYNGTDYIYYEGEVTSVLTAKG